MSKPSATPTTFFALLDELRDEPVGGVVYYTSLASSSIGYRPTSYDVRRDVDLTSDTFVIRRP